MKQLTEQNFKPLPISLEHGRLGGLLPGPHRDPFDRILAAQVVARGPLTRNAARFGHLARWGWSGGVEAATGVGHRCTLDPTYVFTASSPPP